MPRKLFVSAALPLTMMIVAPQAAFAQDNGAAASVSAADEGKALYSADGRRIGPIYKVDSSGRVGLIIRGKMVVVPAQTISRADGKLTTSLTLEEVKRSS